MPSCSKGHKGGLRLVCETCGEPLSYRGSAPDLVGLPEVIPEYGKVSVVSAGLPRVEGDADWSGTVSMAEEESQDASSFTAARIKGGSWLDFHSRYSRPLWRWMKLVGYDRTMHRVLVLDTTSPLSVAAISAVPRLEGTLVIASTAERESTPMEQNSSYAAISVALRRKMPLIVIDRAYMRDMLFFSEGMGIVAQERAMAHLVSSLLEASDDVIDLVERDIKLGVQVHCLSPLIGASAAVYRGPSEAFLAQEDNLSIEAGPQDIRTIYPIVFAKRPSFPEFERSFSAYRNRQFKGTLSAECRFHERRGGMDLYDVLVLYGLDAETATRTMAEGYNLVLKSVPELKVDGLT